MQLDKFFDITSDTITLRDGIKRSMLSHAAPDDQVKMVDRFFDTIAEILYYTIPRPLDSTSLTTSRALTRGLLSDILGAAFPSLGDPSPLEMHELCNNDIPRVVKDLNNEIVVKSLNQLNTLLGDTERRQDLRINLRYQPEAVLAWQEKLGLDAMAHSGHGR